MKKRLAGIVIGIAAVVSLGTIIYKQSVDNQKSETQIFAMDTFMILDAYGKNGKQAVSLGEKEINRLEQLLSTTQTESDIYKLNSNEENTLNEECIELIKAASEVSERSQGAFDLSIYPIVKEWGFTTGDYKVPSEDEIGQLLNLVNYKDIALDGNKVSFAKKGMQIDLGGIAKGYASDRVIKLFKDTGVKSGLITLGGNVQALGTRPDGSLWRVGVRSPLDETDYIGVLSVKDKAVITSGGYERYFEENGKKYHHIIDPATGSPSESGLISVTIISESGTLADALSTTLFVLGEEEAIAYWRQYGGFDAVLITEDKRVIVTEGIMDNFEISHTQEFELNNVFR